MAPTSHRHTKENLSPTTFSTPQGLFLCSEYTDKLVFDINPTNLGNSSSTGNGEGTEKPSGKTTGIILVSL